MQFLFVIVSALAAVNVAFASPHRYQHLARHHAIAARAPVPVLEQPAPLRKRQSAGRKCKTRSSSAPASTSSSSTVTPTPTPTPTPTVKAAVVQPPPAVVTPPPAAAAPAPAAPAPAPAAPPAKGNIGSFMAGTNSGDGTFYDAGLGACGITNTDDQLFAAIAHSAFDSIPGATANPNLNPICGRQVTAHYNGNSVTVPITDRCGGCDRQGSLDFSKPAFDKLTNGNQGLGRIQITWEWAS